jgi:uncharacterized damage-inducible protein DinB
LLPELSNYLLRLDDLRSQIREIISGVPVDGLNWRPFGDSGEHHANSLAVLTAHIAGSERYWIGEVVGGKPPARDRDAEFVKVAKSVDELYQLIDLAAAETREVLSNLSQTDLERTVEAMGKNVPVRWAILHIVDHTALHIGHMQMTFQLWSGGDIRPSPVWFKRLPKGNG